MKEASHQKIQVYPVKPIVDSNNEDDVRHFEHSRSFKKDESETESKNSIEQRWVERRIFTTTDSFPSISTSNRIVNVKSIILRPVSLIFDPKLTQNDQNGPKMAKNDPKLTPNGQKLIQNWPKMTKIDPKLIHKWSKFDPK